MTQELIANILGVRREGVTEGAGKLQRAGIIRYVYEQAMSKAPRVLRSKHGELKALARRRHLFGGSRSCQGNPYVIAQTRQTIPGIVCALSPAWRRR